MRVFGFVIVMAAWLAVPVEAQMKEASPLPAIPTHIVLRALNDFALEPFLSRAFDSPVAVKAFTSYPIPGGRLELARVEGRLQGEKSAGIGFWCNEVKVEVAVEYTWHADLAKLAKDQFHWSPRDKRLTVKLPPLEPGWKLVRAGRRTHGWQGHLASNARWYQLEGEILDELEATCPVEAEKQAEHARSVALEECRRVLAGIYKHIVPDIDVRVVE